ncbi:MAG: hypothetical protein K2N99_01830, partial [Malacoplasma sp.]|nr:hypothetical protein [Malacoplasma sp.]
MGEEVTDKGAYTIDQIEHLDDVQHIRQRVSMYLGTVYEPGLFKLDCEPIQNVLDEHAEGYGNQCNVTLDSSKNLMIVEDFARGIPAPALKMILSKIHTGGKFNNKIYKYHAGSNSVGCSVLKALSRWLKIEVYNDSFMYKGKLEPARHAWIEAVDGYIVNDFLEDLPNGIPAGKHSGTTVSYIADERVLKTTTHDVKRLCDQMNNLSYSNQGLKFVFNHDGIVD